MNETPFSLSDIASLTALANGIIPADERDAGAALVQAGPIIAARMKLSPYAEVFIDALKAANDWARNSFDQPIKELDPDQIHQLLENMSLTSPAFFRQIRAEVCALYLSDPGVWQRIGFPGASTDLGGYPDFDQPQI